MSKADVFDDGAKVYTRLSLLSIVVAYLAHFNTYQRTTPAVYALIEDFYGRSVLTWLLLESESNGNTN